MFKIKNRISKFDRLMAAISFAEANEPEIALDVMTRDLEEKKQKRLGLRINRREQPRPDFRT
jgi:hypothetical protein